MKEIKRYSIDCKGLPFFADDGEFIAYSEHLKAMALLEARCKEQLDILKNIQNLLSSKYGLKVMSIENCLSRDFTTAHLNALVEQKASEMFGKPVAWKIRHHEDDIDAWKLTDIEQVYVGSWDVTPLYAKKVIE